MLNSIRLQNVVRRLSIHTVLLAGSLIMVIPLLWTLSTSLKTQQQIAIWPPEWIPNPVKWSNYIEVFGAAPVMLWIRNSLVIVAANVFGSVVTCSLVAYGFARMRFPGRDALFILLLSTLMMPYIVRLIPLYVFYSQIGWLNTFLPVTVPQLLARNPFFIFLLRQFFKGIPFELSDAARIDGCGEFGIWWRVILPLCRPILGAWGILTFTGLWKSFFWPFVVLGSESLFTLEVGLQTLQQQNTTDYGLVMAGATVSAVPMIIIFFIFQKQIVRGLTFGAVKG